MEQPIEKVKAAAELSKQIEMAKTMLADINLTKKHRGLTVLIWK